jgi:hypothetical protein
LGSFSCPKAGTWDRLFYFPSEGRHAVDFSSRKNPTASVGYVYYMPHLSYPSWFDNTKKLNGIRCGWWGHLVSHCEKTSQPSIHSLRFAFTQVDSNCQWQLVLFIGWVNALNHPIYKKICSWQLLSTCVLSSPQQDVPEKNMHLLPYYLTHWLPLWISVLFASGLHVKTCVVFVLLSVAVSTSNSEHTPPKLM